MSTEQSFKLTLSPSTGTVTGGILIQVEGIPKHIATALKAATPKHNNTWVALPTLSVSIGPEKVPCVANLSGDSPKLSFRLPPGSCVGKVRVIVCHCAEPHWEGKSHFRYTTDDASQYAITMDPNLEDKDPIDADEDNVPLIDHEDRPKTWHQEALGKFAPSGMHATNGKRQEPVSLQQMWIAEFTGTLLLVVFGVGSVNSAVLSGAQVGLWQVATVWGFGLSIAILCTATISGAHLNPAVSLAFALLRPHDMSMRKMLYYWSAQFAGAFLAGIVNLVVFGKAIKAMEARLGITRGAPDSVVSAMVFGEYFPNPGFQYNPVAGNVLQGGSLGWDATSTVTVMGSLGIETWGTAILMFVILALADDRNTALARKELAPFFIGFTVAVLISLYAPLNQAGFNPARDFGPRAVAMLAGWDKVAIPGPNWGFWTYLVGPCIGAPLGGAFHDFVLARGLRTKSRKC